MNRGNHKPSLLLPIAVKNRKQYLKTLAQRLIYLHDKQKTLPEDTKYPSFIIDEINAMYWLLAQYEMHSSCDVGSIIHEFDRNGVVSLERYAKYVESVRAIENSKLD